MFAERRDFLPGLGRSGALPGPSRKLSGQPPIGAQWVRGLVSRLLDDQSAAQGAEGARALAGPNTNSHGPSFRVLAESLVHLIQRTVEGVRRRQQMRLRPGCMVRF
ncbi:MAG: hypothetical protein JWN04_5415 [Myxococcaceae bacterium]|nr:hypothetical protein [Myxococcaceae bacterium]